MTAAPPSDGGIPAGVRGEWPLEDIGCLNVQWALSLLEGMVAAGVRALALSPGARSTPVVIAAQRLETEGRLEIVPILDERSAGFFALGAARGSARPVALLATSGSGPAHWYPAVIEAAEAGIPLVLLSADRPPYLRGWGANQTVDQTRLFGAFVREFHDPGLPQRTAWAHKAQRALGARAATVALAPCPGPVQINLPFEEPLVPVADCPGAMGQLPPSAAGEDGSPVSPARRRVRAAAPVAELQVHDWPTGTGLIVCGPDADPWSPAGAADRAGTTSPLARALQRCSERLGLAVLADPLSGLRAGAAAAGRITGYDALLRNIEAAQALRPDWVLRIGRAPVSKILGAWLEGVASVLVDPAGRWSDPSHDVVARITADPAALCDALVRDRVVAPRRDGLDLWRAADRHVRELANEHLAAARWHEGHIIRALFAAMADYDGLLCANSLPIRQLDTWSGAAGVGVPGAAWRLFGNRGASGIDGQLSTLAGLNYAGVPCWGLFGDLSACHDLSGLLLAARLERPVLVLNNGGGRIFDTMPQCGLPDFRRLWGTPVAPDFAVLAKLAGLRHWRVGDAQGLARALSQADLRPGLIEILVDADASRAAHLAFWRRVSETSLVDASTKSDQPSNP